MPSYLFVAILGVLIFSIFNFRPKDAGWHLPLAARVFISRRGRLDRSSVEEVAPGRAARGRCGICSRVCYRSGGIVFTTVVCH